MKFEDFSKFCKSDISRFKKHFFSFMMLSGEVPIEVAGFHLSGGRRLTSGRLSDEEKQQNETSLEILKLFRPLLVYAGSIKLQGWLADNGYKSELYPWFEDGGFAVVTVTPLELRGR